MVLVPNLAKPFLQSLVLVPVWTKWCELESGSQEPDPEPPVITLRTGYPPNSCSYYLEAQFSKEQTASLIYKHDSSQNIWKNQITGPKTAGSFPVFHHHEAPRFPDLHVLFNKGFLSTPNRAPLLTNFFSGGAAIYIHTRKLGMLVHLNELYYPKGTMISPSQMLICVLILQLCLKWKECIFEFRNIQKKLKINYEVRWKLIWKCWKLQVMKEKHCQKLNPSHSFPFSQWFNTFAKITENGITAIVLEFTFKFHFLAFTRNR